MAWKKTANKKKPDAAAEKNEKGDAKAPPKTSEDRAAKRYGSK